MNHQTWMRKWIYCADCQMSWFEEGGQEPTCQCKKVFEDGSQN